MLSACVVTQIIFCYLERFSILLFLLFNLLQFSTSLFFSLYITDVQPVFSVSASDGGWAAPVSLRLSTGPGCQRTAGDPRPLRLLRHPGAAKCQRGQVVFWFGWLCLPPSQKYILFFLVVHALFLVWVTKISLIPAVNRPHFQQVGILW